jgi:hypothetical protein
MSMIDNAASRKRSFHVGKRTWIVWWRQLNPEKSTTANHVFLTILMFDRDLRKIAEDCAILLCPPVTMSVHVGLPRELRDQIYDHLWEQKWIDSVDEFIATSHKAYKGKLNPSTQSLRDWVLPAPYFANARFVGENFAREAATRFFRALTETEVHYTMVRAYLDVETFGNMAFRPREVIRHLTIDVAWSVSEWEELAYSDLWDCMNSLLALQVRNDLTIDIYLSRDLQFSRNLFHVLDTIKPAYQTLVQKGVKIKVLGYRFFTPRWRNHEDINANMRPKRLCTTAEQMSYYFDRTPEDWLQMKEAEINVINPPQRRMKHLEVRYASLLTVSR